MNSSIFTCVKYCYLFYILLFCGCERLLGPFVHSAPTSIRLVFKTKQSVPGLIAKAYNLNKKNRLCDTCRPFTMIGLKPTEKLVCLDSGSIILATIDNGAIIVSSFYLCSFNKDYYFNTEELLMDGAVTTIRKKVDSVLAGM